MEQEVDKVTLFGEFDQVQDVYKTVDPPVKGVRSATSSPDLPMIQPPVNREELEVREVRPHTNFSDDPPRTDVPENDLKATILEVAAASQGFFRHQQIGEPDLTTQEKRKIATDLLDHKPAVFLSRFGKYLSEIHLDYFEKDSDQYEISFFLREARQQQCKYVSHHRKKNRRFTAMQKMISAGDEHFSEESMRQRNPLLYQQLVRRHQTEEERALLERPDMTNCSLSNIIIEHMDLDRERDLKKRLEGEEEEEEFDSDSDDGDADDKTESLPVSEEEKAALRREFVQAAYQNFLAGRDFGIDYKSIDEDASLDDLNIETRDTEERYFQEDDPID